VSVKKKKKMNGAQINNLVELDFLKIFYLVCLTWKKKVRCEY
jgi:hypothetical protein